GYQASGAAAPPGGQPAGQYGTYVTPPAGAAGPNLQTALPNTPDYLASMMGVQLPQLQQQYQSYVSAVNQSVARMPAGKDVNVQALPMNEWVDSQLNTLEGAYKPILDYYAQSYAINYGANIPPDLMSQL